MNQSKANLSIQGARDVKRRFTLPAMTHQRDAQVIAERISRLSGVRGAETDIGRQRVTVVYDITRLDYQQVLDALVDTGFPIPDTWWSRLKANWLQGLDENGRANANAPEAPCCGNPKGIAPKKRH